MKRTRSDSCDLSEPKEGEGKLAMVGADGAVKDEATEDKAERNRERNREHAKRTRLRKKEMIEGMKARLLDLQREAAELEQLLEESNTANILMHLSVKMANGGTVDDAAAMAAEMGDKPDPHKLVLPKGNIVDQLRHRVRAEAAQSMKKAGDGSLPAGGAKTAGANQRSASHTSDHPASTSSEDRFSKVKEEETLSNANTSKASDSLDSEKSSNENGSGQEEDSRSRSHPPPPLSKSFATWSKEEAERLVGEHMGDLGDGVDDDDDHHDLKQTGSPETVKRERNRMHAKLTRDRKKLFTHRMQQLIQALERNNVMMRERLGSLIHSGSAPMNVPAPINFPHQQSAVLPRAGLSGPEAGPPLHHPGMMGLGFAPPGPGYGYHGMYPSPFSAHALSPHTPFPLGYPAQLIASQYGGVPAGSTAEMYMRSLAAARGGDEAASLGANARHIGALAQLYPYMNRRNTPVDRDQPE